MVNNGLIFRQAYNIEFPHNRIDIMYICYHKVQHKAWSQTFKSQSSGHMKLLVCPLGMSGLALAETHLLLGTYFGLYKSGPIL